MTSHTDLIVKVLTAPVLVGSASLIGRRWGPAVSGWLLSLPMISGPVLAFLAVERGRAFTANAAFGGMLGLLSFALFCLIYSHACSRLGWFGSSTLALGGFCLPALLFHGISVSVIILFLCVVILLLVVAITLPRVPPQQTAARAPEWEVPARIVVATASLLLITWAAEWLGPRLSGVLTSFPAITTVFASFTLKFYGAAATVRLLRGVVFGMFTLAGFFLVIATAIQSTGTVIAFMLASAVALATHFVSLRLLRHTAQYEFMRK
jgi:hypothetical protein